MITTPDADAILPSDLFIGGAWTGDSTGGSFAHVNPSTGKPQRTMAMAGPAEIDAAVAAARSAFGTWRSLDPTARRRMLMQLGALFASRVDQFADISGLEGGTPRLIGRSLAANGAAWWDASASWADKLAGEVVPTGSDVFDYELVEPMGVVAVVVTWNAPVLALGMCVAPALAAGCTVVLKPSELSAFSSLYFAQLCEEAGLPPGVVNVVPGGVEAGARLVAHPDVAKVSFTGGVSTARRISASVADQLKPLLLELGGKSASIVFEDADLDVAAAHVSQTVVLSGQACSHPTRLLVQDAVYEAMVERVAARWSNVPIGDPFEEGVMMGPVINEDACGRILGMIEQARGDGAQLVTGGERLGGKLSDGYFIAPTVFSNVDPGAALARDEVFGPVLSVIRFGTEEEAVRIANDSQFGLAGYLHSRDISRCIRVAAQLEVGGVGINGGGAPGPSQGTFGGVKQSGYGREGG
jgi:aldehyde dehydrogenase (NAD+)